jgi:hypothetical protein
LGDAALGVIVEGGGCGGTASTVDDNDGGGSVASWWLKPSREVIAPSIFTSATFALEGMKTKDKTGWKKLFNPKKTLR